MWSTIVTMAAAAAAGETVMDDGWVIMTTNIVSGEHLKDSAVHVYGAVPTWQACQAACAANTSCLEFDYADNWSTWVPTPTAPALSSSRGCRAPPHASTETFAPAHNM